MPIVSGSVVISGSLGQPVAQNDDGMLMAAMYGTYAGNLEIIALNSEHAMRAVLEDPEDDWNQVSTIGLNELATRLDALQQFDNRGRQIWCEDFEDTVLKWRTFVSGGSTSARSTAASWHGAASCLHNHPGPGLGTAIRYRKFYNPTTGKYSMEMAFSALTTDFFEIRMQLEVFDGTNQINQHIRIQGTTGNLQYRNNAGGWTDVGGTVGLIADIHFWHKIKLVVDADSVEYLRLIVNGTEHDLSGISSDLTPSALCPHINIAFYSEGVAGSPTAVYFDNIIFSHLEPDN